LQTHFGIPAFEVGGEVGHFDGPSRLDKLANRLATFGDLYPLPIFQPPDDGGKGLLELPGIYLFHAGQMSGIFDNMSNLLLMTTWSERFCGSRPWCVFPRHIYCAARLALKAKMLSSP